MFWFQYTVNDVEVIKADMFTFGGIVNEIGGLLHPARLQECDEKNITVGFVSIILLKLYCHYNPLLFLAHMSKAQLWVNFKRFTRVKNLAYA